MTGVIPICGEFQLIASLPLIWMAGRANTVIIALVWYGEMAHIPA